MLPKEVSISWRWPPMRQSKPERAGSSTRPIAAAMSSRDRESRSRPIRLAVTTATRSPSARRISAGPSTSSTSRPPCRERDRRLAGPGSTVRLPQFRRHCPGTARSERRRMSIVRSSRWMSVATVPWTLERTDRRRPRSEIETRALANRSRSKRICSSGLPPSVEDLMSARPGYLVHAHAPDSSASRSSNTRLKPRNSTSIGVRKLK